MKKLFLLTMVLFAAFGLSGCNYNSLTGGQQNARAKWANVEVLLQSRSDLIPNLVAAAQSAGINEQQIFGQIAEARSKLLNAQTAAPAEAKTPEQREAVIEASNSFGGTVGRLLNLQEAYPQLRSNENFLQLQQSIEGTERRIAVARQDYNTAATTYNTERAQFPGVLTASIFGFKEEPLFKAAPEAQQAPTIDPNVMRQGSTNK